jgi:hypothetical protein
MSRKGKLGKGVTEKNSESPDPASGELATNYHLRNFLISFAGQ